MHAVNIPSGVERRTVKHFRETSEVVHSHHRHASCLNGLGAAAGGHNVVPGICKPLYDETASCKAMSDMSHMLSIAATLVRAVACSAFSINQLCAYWHQ